MKYPISDMQHKHLFIYSLLPHFKYPLRQQKFQNQAEALQAVMQLEENQYKQTDPSIQELKEYDWKKKKWGEYLVDQDKPLEASIMEDCQELQFP